LYNPKNKENSGANGLNAPPGGSGHLPNAEIQKINYQIAKDRAVNGQSPDPQGQLLNPDQQPAPRRVTTKVAPMKIKMGQIQFAGSFT